jgi:3-oxoacyl-[acyl-carrier protein] reductase
MLGLASKRAVVTGGGSGIGRAVARRLSEAGAAVTVFEADEEKRSAVGPGAAFLRVDVTDEAQVARAFAEVGPFEILVNNAGTGTLSSLLDLEEEEWDRVMAVNLKGPFLCTKHAARAMAKHAIRGAIVNVASINAVLPFDGIAHYCASKGGVVAFTKAAALELGPLGIRVNAVGPSFVETRLTADLSVLPGILEDHAAKSVFGRLATPDDIAKVVLFLASDLAGWVTGQTLYAEGGTLLSGPKGYLTAFEEATGLDAAKEWKP